MSPSASLTIYCAVILIASLIGGWAPMLFRLTHERTQLAVSFVAGVMLGIGLLDLLPHAVMAHQAQLEQAAGPGADTHGHGSIEPVVLWMLGGFLVMFLLERFFCFHHHDVDEQGSGDAASCGHAEHQPRRVTWAGAWVGLSLHSLIAGIALAASVAADGEQADAARWAGFGTFLMIALHKPFDSLTVGTLMATSGSSMRARHIVNGLFALVIPLGVLVFHIGMTGGGEADQALVGPALAFSAGAFLCIALSDLLPELQFHEHDRIKLSVALVLGLALAWGVTRLEAASHAPHAQPDSAPAQTAGGETSPSGAGDSHDH